MTSSSESHGTYVLVPCPFCGAHAEMSFDDTSDYRAFHVWSVACAECDCYGPESADKAVAIAAWNRRVPTVTQPEDGLVKRAERVFAIDPARNYYADHPSVIGVELLALITSLRAERDEAQADAYRSSLVAVARLGELDKANERANKNWRDFRDLRLQITGDGPMCRDCADFDGRCQGDGRPCDPDEAVKEQIAIWRKALTELSEVADKGTLQALRDANDRAEAAEARATTLQTRLDAALEALRPLAARANKWKFNSEKAWVNVPLRELRAARQIIDQEGGE